MMRAPVLSGLFICLFTLLVFQPRPAVAAEELTLVLENFIFAKNLEYPNLDDVAGRTFFGDILSPRLRHRFNNQIAIEAGAILSLPFGASDSVDAADALIRLDYEFRPGAHLIMGTLHRDHDLYDALFDDDLAFLRPAEQGIQFLIKWPHWHQDLWINWQQREDDFGFEKFDVGAATELRFGGFRLDFQMHWIHFGGERFPPDNEENNPAFALGIGYHLNLTETFPPFAFLQAIDLRIIGYYAEDRDSRDDVPNRDGDGLELRLDVWPFGVHLYYTEWFGNDFIAGDGDPLFTFDRVSQIGGDYTVTIYDHVNISFGGALHIVDDNVVYSLFLTAHWQIDYHLTSVLRHIRPKNPTRLRAG